MPPVSPVASWVGSACGRVSDASGAADCPLAGTAATLDSELYYCELYIPEVPELEKIT